MIILSIMVIELSGVQCGVKLYVCLRKFHLKSIL